MADRRKVKPKRNTKRSDDEKLTKQENQIARFLRFNCPSKTSSVSNEEVHYFTSSKAIDTLLASKWGTKAKKDPLFTNRQSAVTFMQTLLNKGLFWHARKLVPKRKERPIEKEGGKEKKERETDNGESPKVHKSPKKSKKDKEKEALAIKDKDEDESKTDEKKDDDEKDSKKKKKIKLELHADQVFVDGNDVYVWVFDPTPWTKFLIGLALVLGSILVCLFPLWPPWLRLGIYYLSLVAMGLVGVLLGLAIFRTLLFGIIWCATLGVHHFWLLPNLTEDCGFFESFKPFYSYKYSPKHADKKKDDDAQVNEDDDGKVEGKELVGDTDSDRDSEAEGLEDDDEEGMNKSQQSSSNSVSGGDQQDSPDVRQRRKGRSRRADADDFELVDGGDN